MFFLHFWNWKLQKYNFFLINREKTTTLIILILISESFSLIEIINKILYYLNVLTARLTLFSKTTNVLKIIISKNSKTSTKTKISTIIFSKLSLILFFINYKALKTTS